MRRICLGFLLLVVALCMPVRAFPNFSLDTSVKIEEHSQPYDRMQIIIKTDDGTKKIERFGQIYTVIYRLFAREDFENYRHTLKSELLKQVGYHGRIEERQRFFHLSSDPEQWVYISVYRDHYEVRYFRETSYLDTVSFDSSIPYVYSERLKKHGVTVPPNTDVPHIRDFVIDDALYVRKALHRFETPDANITARGEVWKIKYAWRGQQRDTVRRYAILHQFRDLIKARGAEIVFEDTTHLLFQAVQDGKKLWGEFGGNDFGASLVLVREAQKSAEKVLDVAALKRALDVSGHVALKGIYFDTGKATLKPESNAALNAAVLLLKRYPELKLSIEGHTDSTGNAAINLALSSVRAVSVKKALERSGIDPSRLRAVGYGDTKPIASNDTQSGRAANRRVELRQQGDSGAAKAIDAFFFKPAVEAKMVEHRTKAYDEFELHENDGHIKRVIGNSASVRYVLLKNGRRDRSVSAYEIVQNMQATLAALGAEIVAQTEDSILFVIRNGQHQKNVYGGLEAAMGGYRIYTIAAEGVEYATDKNSTKKAVIK